MSSVVKVRSARCCQHICPLNVVGGQERRVRDQCAAQYAWRDDMSAPVWDADLVTAAKGLHGEVERVVIHDSAGSTMREWTTTQLVTSVQSGNHRWNACG